MFTKKDSTEFKPLIPGVHYRPLVFGQLTLLCEFLLEKGHQIPLHHHFYEQTGYLISGKVIFRIGDEITETLPGDSWCIPENIPHSVEILEDARVVELFSPPRPDYMPQKPE